jgi:hypothetical protein
MSRTTNDLRIELQKSIALMKTLRDEVRVSLHLAGMEAKDRWNKLESHLLEVERAAHDTTDASRRAVGEAVTAIKDFRDSFKRS